MTDPKYDSTNGIAETSITPSQEMYSGNEAAKSCRAAIMGESSGCRERVVCGAVSASMTILRERMPRRQCAGITAVRVFPHVRP
ncbi:hypothetical protein GCM10009532_12770 [Microbacterium aurantiacum]